MNQKLIKRLGQKGVYFTHLVKELVQVLVKSKKPLSVDEILFHFRRKREFFPHNSSLYRQLIRLTKLNIIEESIFSDGIKRYCFIYDRNRHYHFECRKCGYVENVPMKNWEQSIKKIANHLEARGDIITIHTLTFRGICSQCNENSR